MTALEFFGLPASASREDLRRAYIYRARREHPDAGGSAGSFAYLVSMRRAALDEIARRRCAACRGTGFVQVRAGFYGTSIHCKKCAGSGFS